MCSLNPIDVAADADVIVVVVVVIADYVVALVHYDEAHFCLQCFCIELCSNILVQFAADIFTCLVVFVLKS